MRRILHVFATLNLGGAESRIMDMYRYIDRSAVQFDFLILTEERCYFEDEVLSLGGRIFRINHPRNGIISTALDLARLFKSEHFHAIHAHTSYFSGLVVLIAWIYGIKFRVTHARNQHTGTQSWNTKALFLAGRIMCRLFATAKLAISRDAGVFLYGANAEFEVWPNSFNFRDVRAKRKKPVFGTIGDDYIDIVMVARFCKVKNHSFAIQLLKRLVSEGGDRYRLNLFGTGEEEPNIRSEVANFSLEGNVIFWDLQKNINEMLCDFDFLILPSHAEGLGVAVLEGQAAGLLCLVSTGVPEEADIGLGLCRRLPLDVESWAKVINTPPNDLIVTKEEIDHRFEELGYSIERASLCYMDKYGI